MPGQQQNLQQVFVMPGTTMTYTVTVSFAGPDAIQTQTITVNHYLLYNYRASGPGCPNASNDYLAPLLD